ncbi:response regulator transcription factor [Mycolicibacterium obuense]|uniref:Transcriptional regulatory protein TcrA n=1 Tax=Mycolicibacterium obuense TaxID=1807 RepID=A0A0J6W212_9MYCO|nr:response regulator transcription factor [Mycolicibacterium obuense]KMO75778.1 Transcriptional regulatory protein TcrA [Mycolicibacterium obuense]
MTAVLVAGADRQTSTMIRRTLRAQGFSVTVVADGRCAYSDARRGNFDLVILGARMPGMDGFEVVRRLRADGQGLPAVLLTTCSPRARAGATFSTSAEALVSVAPLRADELVQTVRSLVSPRQATRPAELRYGGLRVDLASRKAHVGDYCVDLSTRECDLAATFLRHPGQVLSREYLLRQVWGHDEPESNVVDVYVRYLRRKLGAHWFTTARGVGYRLQAG